MIQVILDRIGEFDGQTYGVLTIGEGESARPRFVTIEDIWRDNQRNVSCIPVGEYTCREYDSPTFGPTFIVDRVPGRSGILFHPGNNHVDTQGCILVGSSYNPDIGGSGIINSRLGFAKFLMLLKGVATFTLRVRDLRHGRTGT